jgi:hypothetical protein
MILLGFLPLPPFPSEDYFKKEAACFGLFFPLSPFPEQAVFYF